MPNDIARTKRLWIGWMKYSHPRVSESAHFYAGDGVGRAVRLCNADALRDDMVPAPVSVRRCRSCVQHLNAARDAGVVPLVDVRDVVLR